MQPLVARCLEGYAVGHAGHEVAAFGEELQLGLGRCLVNLRLSAQGAQGHLVDEVARLFRFVEDGEDAAVELLVVAVVFLGHALVVEPLLGIDAMGMLGDAPVELPARVGPQLVVAAIEGVGQYEGAMRLSALKLQLLALHEVAVLVQQLGIEDTADAARCACVCAAHVSLVVDGVAQKVAGVVRVNEDLFLRNGLAELPEPVGPAFERGGSRLSKSTEKRKNETVNENESFHSHVILLG